MPQRRPASLG